MGKSNYVILRGTSLLLGLYTSYSVFAVDLLPIDVNPVQVGACAHQVRFKVKLASRDNEYGARNIRASYRIGVYSASARKPLTTFSVSKQKVDENIVFVIPSDLLSCVNNVTIVVDDRNQLKESNKSNNRIKVRWKQHGKEFGSPCAAQLEKCSK